LPGLSLKYLIRSALIALSSGLRNAIETVGHLVAQHTPPSPANDEFMGMTEYVAESFHDLLMGETELPSTSDSSRGSHHPSHECFMAGIPEGHIESIHEEEATPMNDLDDEVERGVGVLPRLWVEQLKARHLELEETRLQLEQERMKLDQEIKRHGDGGRERTMAYDVNRRIIADDEALPHFARAS